MRAFTALILSLVLAIASVSMAVARGQASIGDSFTICTADGTATITLDANGYPVPMAPHLCPDCVSAATVFTLTAETPLPARPITSQRVKATAPVPPMAFALPRRSHARDPPSLSV